MLLPLDSYRGSWLQAWPIFVAWRSTHHGIQRRALHVLQHAGAQIRVSRLSPKAPLAGVGGQLMRGVPVPRDARGPQTRHAAELTIN